MTRDELIAKLWRLWRLETDGGDIEADHQAADALLLSFIDDAEVTAAFRAIKKWYA